MRVCNVVLDSVWNDPRVKRTITSCQKAGIDVYAIGLIDVEYNEAKVKELTFPIKLVNIEDKYYRENRTIFTKISREIIQAYRISKAIIETNAELIHANDLPALLPAYFAAKKLKCKLVYDSHEIATENSGIIKQPLKKFIWQIIERYLIKRVDLVVSVSHSASNQFVKMYRIKKPMVITNCAFRTDKTHFFNKKKGIFEVLLHGKFYEGRGYEAFVRTGNYLKDFPQIQLVLRGYGELETTLRKIASEETVDNLRFDPPVELSMIINKAASSHVGIAITEPICLNFIHSVSNKLFEYAAAGIPVIMSDIPEHRYLNKQYDFGLILEENTPEKISEAVLDLYTNNDLYNRLSNNAIKMSEILNWDTEIQRLFDAYKKLVKNDKDQSA